MLGFVFYVAYGSILLKHVVDPVPAIGVPVSGYCVDIGRVQGVISLICSLTYLIDTIWCCVAFCKETK